MPTKSSFVNSRKGLLKQSSVGGHLLESFVRHGFHFPAMSKKESQPSLTVWSRGLRNWGKTRILQEDIMRCSLLTGLLSVGLELCEVFPHFAQLAIIPFCLRQTLQYVESFVKQIRAVLMHLRAISVVSGFIVLDPHLLSQPNLSCNQAAPGRWRWPD